MENEHLYLQTVELWALIINKITGSEKDTENRLNLLNGASESDLAEVEMALELQLPDEMKAFYAVHNGQIWELEVELFVRNLLLLNTKEIIESWQFLNEEFEGDGLLLETDESIKPMLWNTKWIPFANNGGGDYVCLDTDPTSEGTYGQVLYFFHDEGFRNVSAKSLFEFLKICIEESDDYS